MTCPLLTRSPIQDLIRAETLMPGYGMLLVSVQFSRELNRDHLSPLPKTKHPPAIDSGGSSVSGDRCSSLRLKLYWGKLTVRNFRR